MNRRPTDSSGISFTALYTGAVWHRHGLSDDTLATRKGRWLYRLMTPFEAAIGGNIRTFLLQRHLILDHLIDQVIQDQGITQVLEIACGAEGSRWFGLSRLAAEFDGGFVHLACQILGVAGVREGFPKPAPCGTSLWRLSSAIHGSAQFWKAFPHTRRQTSEIYSHIATL